MTVEELCLENADAVDIKCTYECVREELISDELGVYVSYGLRCVSDGEEDFFISDVSSERKVVEALAKRCNLEGLEYVHVYDVIEDILAEFC